MSTSKKPVKPTATRPAPGNPGARRRGRPAAPKAPRGAAAPAGAVGTVGDLTLDPENLRRHSERGQSVIEAGLREVGAARSIVVDENNVVIAGNGVTEAFSAAGMSRVRFVEADGEELIAVRRRGLTPEQKLRLALLDNRTNELSTWDPEALSKALAAAPELSSGLWSPEEIDRQLAKLTAQFNAAANAGEAPGEVVSPGDDALPPALVHMQQLFFSPEQFEAFHRCCGLLKEKWDAGNVSIIALEAVRRCAQST